MIVALEGLPGAGKTTSAGLVSKDLGAEVLQETTQDHPFLESVYDDDHRFDLEVELAFLLLHAGAYRRIDPNALTVSDYSPFKDVLFAEEMLNGNELDLWTKTYEHVYANLDPPELVIFLRVPLEECLRRIRGRGRDFEAGLTIDRLDQLSKRYEESLSELGDRVNVLDVEPGRDADSVAGSIAQVIRGNMAER
jgi:deoxyadenosine/deoxycytidine kinase